MSAYLNDSNITFNTLEYHEVVLSKYQRGNSGIKLIVLAETKFLTSREKQKHQNPS